MENNRPFGEYSRFGELIEEFQKQLALIQEMLDILVPQYHSFLTLESIPETDREKFEKIEYEVNELETQKLSIKKDIENLKLRQNALSSFLNDYNGPIQ